MAQGFARLLLPLAVAGSILAVGGCTRLSEQDRTLLGQAKATSQQASTDAAAAKASADRAAASAQQAADAAKAAQASAAGSAADAKAANEKADRMFQRSLRK